MGALDAMAVRVGQSAELQIEGSPQTIKAQVVRINPSAQAGSRNVLAYLHINNPADSPGSTALPLRQGLFAQGTLGTASTPLLSLPLSAVRTDKPAPYVQAIENGQVVHKAVELGARGSADGQTLVAIKGLAEGALVIRGEIGALREGTQVRFTQMVTPTTPARATSPVKPAP